MNIEVGDLEGRAGLPGWLRFLARDVESVSVGPLIRDLRTLADRIEAAYADAL